MAGGHDQLWKDLIRAFPIDFLRLVDGELAAQLELSALSLEPVEEFLDRPTGAGRRMDLAGNARSLEGAEVLVHVEIELRFRDTVPPRLLFTTGCLAYVVGGRFTPSCSTCTEGRREPRCRSSSKCHAAVKWGDSRTEVSPCREPAPRIFSLVRSLSPGRSRL